MHAALKDNTVWLEVPFEVVAADVERETRRHAEQPLQRLRFDFHLFKLPLRGRVTLNNAEAYIACCLAGLGLIQIPAYDVREELAMGRLLEVMPAHRADPLPMHLLFPHRRHPSQRLRVFVDWLQGVLEAAVV